MAEFDANADSVARRAGWEAFIKTTMYASFATIGVLVLMAIFLL